MTPRSIISLLVLLFGLFCLVCATFSIPTWHFGSAQVQTFPCGVLCLALVGGVGYFWR